MDNLHQVYCCQSGQFNNYVNNFNFLLLVGHWEAACKRFFTSHANNVSSDTSSTSISFGINLLNLFSLPWNQTSLLGYFGEITSVMTFTGVYLILNGTFLLLFTSICLHHRAFYKIIKQSIDKLNLSEEHRCDAKFLCDLIRFHITIKE